MANNSISTTPTLFSASQGSATVTKLSPVPQTTLPKPEARIGSSSLSGVTPRGASGIAIMSRCTTWEISTRPLSAASIRPTVP